MVGTVPTTSSTPHIGPTVPEAHICGTEFYTPIRHARPSPGIVLLVEGDQMDKPFTVYGEPDQNTLDQMEIAMSLEPVVAGALMPDAHLGYGLPIGGVLACKDAVMPYAVGFDIGCRMRMTLVDMPVSNLENQTIKQQILDIIERETRFGVGAAFDPSECRDHPVLCDPLWLQLHKKGIVDYEIVQAQLGTSGSGNHFVDVGVLDVGGKTFTAIMSHSGSRGAGHKICTYYAALAKEQHPEGGDLAWLDIDTAEGIEYWDAMGLAGRYASANHAVIHHSIIDALGCNMVDYVENHHNFAWNENGLFVHRKGATPAGHGVMGVVPGTMADKSYIVTGLGNEASLCSSAHGAGRVMGRNQAKKTLCRDEWATLLEERDILLSGGDLDEAPGAYKNIDEVMGQQRDLARIVATFTPKIVRMA